MQRQRKPKGQKRTPLIVVENQSITPITIYLASLITRIILCPSSFL